MADKPIMFSGQMVRALLDGTKTQTRRVLYPQPSKPWGSLFSDKGKWWTGDSLTGDLIERLDVQYEVGDTLWVRENWRTEACFDDRKPSDLPNGEHVACHWEADGARRFWKYSHLPQGRLRPSIFMPRRFSRLTLTVTNVRVERLHSITLGDICAEGLARSIYEFAPVQRGFDAWQDLWSKINGAGSWEENPWVAAYTFVVEQRNIDQKGGAA